MPENTVRRAHELVEELRADIDFEIDDVIADIVRGLPDDYFSRLRRSDQLKHLKTLLAISICHLDNEIVLRSKDDRQVAVIARQNYPGMLVKILKRLPNDQPMVGAKIFTSKAHDFIIDLFEFESDLGSGSEEEGLERFEVDNSIDEVALSLGVAREKVEAFIAHYPANSQVLNSTNTIKAHYLACDYVLKNGQPFVHWGIRSNGAARLTMASDKLTARELFQRSAEFLAEQTHDIEQAFLNDLTLDVSHRISIASFSVSSAAAPLDRDSINAKELAKLIG